MAVKKHSVDDPSWNQAMQSEQRNQWRAAAKRNGQFRTTRSLRRGERRLTTVLEFAHKASVRSH
eukprot:5429666-Pleurochrysis_carterae.AAC.1